MVEDEHTMPETADELNGEGRGGGTQDGMASPVVI